MKKLVLKSRNAAGLLEVGKSSQPFHLHRMQDCNKT
jgi:hypothetical protein